MEHTLPADLDYVDVVVDIGGTKVLVVLVRAQSIVGETSFSTTAFEQPDDLVAHATSSAMQLAKAHSVRLRCGIAAVPGTIDRSAGTVVRAANLGFRDYPLAARLSANLGGIPVEIDDDANCGVIGEAHRGAAQGSLDVLYVTISTGIGMGALVGGVPVLGSHGSSGELGHVGVVPGGRVCGCGRRGCLEAYASGSAIAMMGAELLAEGDHPLLRSLVGESSAVTAKDVVEAAEQGDVGSTQIIEQAFDHLVRASHMLQVLFDPEVLVFGGGLMTSSFFAEGLISAIHKAESHIVARCAHAPERSVIHGGMKLAEELSARLQNDRQVL